jgi:hypothetical protein
LPKLRIVGYGVNGDPLEEGKLDLPELRDMSTPHELAWSRAFISSSRWREAVTYRHTAPHEYIVRALHKDDDAVADFERFVTFIRRFGYADFFYRIRLIYWILDDYKYWTMGWPLDQTKVINRARTDASVFGNTG